MAFLKNVATRSNDQINLLPADEPDSVAYQLWKSKNYSETLLAAFNQIKTGYRHPYSGHNMYRFFKILKAHGLLGYVSMARQRTVNPIQVEGEYIYVDGEKIYVDDEGFEL